MDTLKDYIVTYKHVPVQTNVSEVEKKILNLMCEHSAKALNKCYNVGVSMDLLMKVKKREQRI